MRDSLPGVARGQARKEEARGATSSEIKIKTVPSVHVRLAPLARFHLLNAQRRAIVFLPLPFFLSAGRYRDQPIANERFVFLRGTKTAPTRSDCLRRYLI